MAGLSVGGGGRSGKKAVDAEVPLVPFIDLLLCCVMFLLVSAVWTQLGRVNTNQEAPGPTADGQPPAPRTRVMLQVLSTGFVLGSTVGERFDIPRVGGHLDVDTLRARLSSRRAIDAANQDLIVAPEDGIPYLEVVAAMDTAVGEGYTNLEVGDSMPL